MYFTLGIIIGFVLGWFVNDKWDWVKSKYSSNICLVQLK